MRARRRTTRECRSYDTEQRNKMCFPLAYAIELKRRLALRIFQRPALKHQLSKVERTRDTASRSNSPHKARRVREQTWCETARSGRPEQPGRKLNRQGYRICLFPHKARRKWLGDSSPPRRT